LLSTTYFDRSFIVVVDRQFIDVNIDRGACTDAKGPRDAKTLAIGRKPLNFRAETYYIRILNVSPVFAESVFFADEARFCRVCPFAPRTNLPQP